MLMDRLKKRRTWGMGVSQNHLTIFRRLLKKSILLTSFMNGPQIQFGDGGDKFTFSKHVIQYFMRRNNKKRRINKRITKNIFLIDCYYEYIMNK